MAFVYFSVLKILYVGNALFAVSAFVWSTKHLKDEWWNYQRGEPAGNKSEWSCELQRREGKEQEQAWLGGAPWLAFCSVLSKDRMECSSYACTASFAMGERLWWAECRREDLLEGKSIVFKIVFKNHLFLSLVYWLVCTYSVFFPLALLKCQCHVCSLGSVFQFSRPWQFQAVLSLNVLGSVMKFKI